MAWRPTDFHHLHRARRLPVLFILVVAGVTGLGVPLSGAQGRGGAGGFTPCGLGQLTSNQIWAQADVVFAARPITNESAASPAGGFDSTLSRVAVTEVFKGLVAQEIVLAATGRPCGGATADAIMGATRQDDGTYRLVGSVSRDQAAAYGGTLPATSGSGPIRALVGVDGGPVDLVAVDGEGVPLGYRLGSSPPVLLTLCPGARTALSFQGNPSDPPSARRLEVIDIATMTTRRRVPWRDPNSPTAIACQDADAGAMSAFVPTQRPDQFGQPGPSGPFGGFDESGPAGVLPPGGAVGPDRAVPSPPTTLPRTSRGTTTDGGKVLRFQNQNQNQKPTELAVSFAEAVGVDAQGGFLSWADATATTLVASDPVTGQPARSTKMPDGLRGQTMAVSDDGRRAVVFAVSSTTPAVGVVEHTPVVVDLTGGAEPKVLPPRPVGLPIRLGFVGDDIVVVHTGTTFSTQDQITTDVIAADGTLKSSTPTVIDASAEAPRAVPPGFPAGVPVPGLEGTFDARLPEQVPRLFGVKVGATMFIPSSVSVTIDPAAAKPPIAATPRLNNGLPLEIDRTPEDRVAIAIAAVAAALLLFMFGGLWAYRAPRNPQPATGGRDALHTDTKPE